MIAEEPYLSENIIKTYVKNIYSKYDVQSKEELIKILAITQKSDGSLCYLLNLFKVLPNIINSPPAI